MACSVRATTRSNSLSCPIIVASHGSRSSRGWSLQTQKYTASRINWLMDIFPRTKDIFSTNSSREIPCWLWLQPQGHVGTHSMTCDWVSHLEPSKDVTSCSTVHQHQCRPTVILLPVSGPVSWPTPQPLWVSFSDIFIDGMMCHLQFYKKLSRRCKQLELPDREHLQP